MSSLEISVLMTVYNGEKYLRRAIDSILGQNCNNFEFIIVNDGRNDQTARILESYKDKRMKVVSGRHEGLTGALNIGAAMCRGNLLARMDADDVAYPDRLQTQAEFLKSNPGTSLVCSDAMLIDGAGDVIGLHRMGRWSDDLLRQALLLRRRGMPVIHPSVMMRREVFDRIGGYRDYTCAEDHDFWLRALEKFRFGHIDKPLVYYRIHPGGVSRSRRLMQKVSSVLSVVTYIVNAQMREDIFVTQTDVLKIYSAEIADYLSANVLPAETSYREVCNFVREGRWLQSLWKGGRTVSAYGTKVFPGRRISLLRLLAERTAGRVIEEICRRKSTMRIYGA